MKIYSRTNITTSDKTTKSGVVSTYYYYTKYPLTMKSKVSKHNLNVLFNLDMRAFLLFMRIGMNLKENPVSENAYSLVTSVTTREQMLEVFDKNMLPKLLKFLVDNGYIAKVSKNLKDNDYYVNPNVFNVLTKGQGTKYRNIYMDMFKDLPKAKYVAPDPKFKKTKPEQQPVRMPLPPKL
jgi:hypothetical protein